MAANLFREERLRLIMELIYEKKKVIVKDLAEKFEKSDSSIRLDLAELESRGLIERTHGGAILASSANNDYVLTKNFIRLREETNRDEKEKIGRATVDLINDGDSIVMDGGSTTYFVALNLHRKRGLTIITTSCHVLPILLEISDAKVYLTGGLVHRDYEDLMGDISIDALKRFKANFAIMGIDGISYQHGLTSTDPTTAQIKRQMMAVSTKTIFVADSTKFGKVGFLHVADFDDVYAVVTDDNLQSDLLDSLKTTQTTFITA